MGQRWTTESILSKQGQSNTFSGLGETIENSLATKKGYFQQIRERNKKGFNSWKLVTSSIGKSTFGGLGNARNSSLATEKGHFQQIRERFNAYANHRKQEDNNQVKRTFGGLGES